MGIIPWNGSQLPLRNDCKACFFKTLPNGTGLGSFVGLALAAGKLRQACQNRSGGPQPDQIAACRFNNRDTNAFHDSLLGSLRISGALSRRSEEVGWRSAHHTEAAVDMQNLTGDPTGQIAEQSHGSASDFFGCDVAAHW